MLHGSGRSFSIWKRRVSFGGASRGPFDRRTFPVDEFGELGRISFTEEWLWQEGEKRDIE
jgi:hypothetical protein